MVALVRLSAGCVYRPVIFSTIGHARVLKEKGNLLKETVPAPLKVEQVQTALFETNPGWGGMQTSQLPANDTQNLSRGVGDKFIQIAERDIAEMYVIGCKRRRSTRMGIHHRIPFKTHASRARFGSLADRPMRVTR
jgi:hypothetical protein